MVLGHTTHRNTPASTVGGDPALGHDETGHSAHNSADAVHVLGDEVTRGGQVIRKHSERHRTLG